jgi:hypothetical protein
LPSKSFLGSIAVIPNQPGCREEVPGVLPNIEITYNYKITVFLKCFATKGASDYHFWHIRVPLIFFCSEVCREPLKVKKHCSILLHNPLFPNI